MNFKSGAVEDFPILDSPLTNVFGIGSCSPHNILGHGCCRHDEADLKERKYCVMAAVGEIRHGRSGGGGERIVKLRPSGRSSSSETREALEKGASGRGTVGVTRV